MIKLSNITKVFQQGNRSIQALNNVSLHVPAGQIYGVIGASGAGKSTLIRCVNLLERPTEGSVQVDGQELTALSEKELTRARRQIGMIFQHFNLLMQKSVIDNICFPLQIHGVKRKDAKERARELLKTVGLEDKEKAYPAQLSGGQKQRVAIARAMVNHPKLLLADEPTGALDSKSGKQVLELFESLNESGVTVVMITHDRKVAEQAKRIVHIIDGEITEEGQEAGNEKEKEN